MKHNYGKATVHFIRNSENIQLIHVPTSTKEISIFKCFHETTIVIEIVLKFSMSSKESANKNTKHKKNIRAV